MKLIYEIRIGTGEGKLPEEGSLLPPFRSKGWIVNERPRRKVAKNLYFLNSGRNQ